MEHPHRLGLAIYEPDIAQNTGAMLRTCACLGVEASLIGPAGFNRFDPRFKRAAMDYVHAASMVDHIDWSAFEAWRRKARRRLVALSTKASLPYCDFAFAPGDILLVGRESAGLPDMVHRAADARVVIPLRAGLRSLNVSVAAGMALGEAMRQLAQTCGGAAISPEQGARPEAS